MINVKITTVLKKGQCHMTKDETIRNAIFKIKHQNIPIVKAWIKKEQLLASENNHRRKKDLNIIKLAAATAIVGTANTLIKNPILSGIIAITSIYIGKEAYKSTHLQKEEKKFNTAIFNYEDLKEYEKLYPKDEKITENEDLKGITKSKILKRVRKVHTL